MRNLPAWAIRTLDAFDFVQDYEMASVMAFGNKIIVIGIPEPMLWVASNDNKAKP